MSSGLLPTHCRNGAIEKMLLEDIYLERRARFRRNDDKRPFDIDGGFYRKNLPRIGGVKNVKVRVTIRAADDRSHHVRRQARAAHPKQHHVGHSLRLDLTRKLK